VVLTLINDKFYKTTHIKSNQSLNLAKQMLESAFTTLNNMELTDRELALRWWDRLTIKEKRFLYEKVFTIIYRKNLTSAEIFWFGVNSKAL
jgi:hypothetical protein